MLLSWPGQQLRLVLMFLEPVYGILLNTAEQQCNISLHNNAVISRGDDIGVHYTTKLYVLSHRYAYFTRN